MPNPHDYGALGNFLDGLKFTCRAYKTDEPFQSKKVYVELRAAPSAASVESDIFDVFLTNGENKKQAFKAEVQVKANFQSRFGATGFQLRRTHTETPVADVYFVGAFPSDCAWVTGSWNDLHINDFFNPPIRVQEHMVFRQASKDSPAENMEFSGITQALEEPPFCRRFRIRLRILFWLADFALDTNTTVQFLQSGNPFFALCQLSGCISTLYLACTRLAGVARTKKLECHVLLYEFILEPIWTGDLSKHPTAINDMLKYEVVEALVSALVTPYGLLIATSHENLSWSVGTKLMIPSFLLSVFSIADCFEYRTDALKQPYRAQIIQEQRGRLWALIQKCASVLSMCLTISFIGFYAFQHEKHDRMKRYEDFLCLGFAGMSSWLMFQAVGALMVTICFGCAPKGIVNPSMWQHPVMVKRSAVGPYLHAALFLSATLWKIAFVASGFFVIPGARSVALSHYRRESSIPNVLLWLWIASSAISPVMFVCMSWSACCGIAFPGLSCSSSIWPVRGSSEDERESRTQGIPKTLSRSLSAA